MCYAKTCPHHVDGPDGAQADRCIACSRKMILEAHPEIKKLYGPDTLFVYKVCLPPSWPARCGCRNSWSHTRCTLIHNTNVYKCVLDLCQRYHSWNVHLTCCCWPAGICSPAFTVCHHALGSQPVLASLPLRRLCGVPWDHHVVHHVVHGIEW